MFNLGAWSPKMAGKLRDAPPFFPLHFETLLRFRESPRYLHTISEIPYLLGVALLAR